MSAVVVPVGAAERSGAGGKAGGLRRLIALGLPVPAAWVVGVQAYRDQLARVVGTSAETRREVLLSMRLTPALEAEIRGALAALGDGPYAVLSSALAEDGAEQSFAGRFDTVLDFRIARASARRWAAAGRRRGRSGRPPIGLGRACRTTGGDGGRYPAADPATAGVRASPGPGETR